MNGPKLHVLNPVAKVLGEQGGQHRGPAVRLSDLNGHVLLMLDNDYEHAGEGKISMNPFYVSLKRVLETRCSLREILWEPSSPSKPSSPERIRELAAKADVVINGTAH